MWATLHALAEQTDPNAISTSPRPRTLGAAAQSGRCPSDPALLALDRSRDLERAPAGETAGIGGDLREQVTPEIAAGCAESPRVVLADVVGDLSSAP